MVIIRLCLINFIISIVIYGNNAVTHWVVTESGRIQAYPDSPFDIRRPYDLLALLDQETRSVQVNALYNELINRKTTIEKKWSSLGSVEKIDEQLPQCLNSEQKFSDLDLYSNFAFNGSGRVDIPLNQIETDVKSYNVPECLRFTTVDSSNPFENIPVLQNKSNIEILPDEYLKNFIPAESLQRFGHEITIALSANVTSWVHYNLASIFWRIKGDGGRSMGCIKRAMQYVPREYRDIPLHNLAGIFYQGYHYKEAETFLQSAIDHAANEPMHYFALGNVYAKLGDHNKSVSYFNKFLELKTDEKDIVDIRHSLLCILKVTKGLMNFQEYLEGILTDLHNYHSQQQQWVRLQERLLWEQSAFDIKFDNVGAFKAGESMAGKKVQRCVQKMSEDSKPIITCNFYNQAPTIDTLKFQTLFDDVEKEKKKLSEPMSHSKMASSEKSSEKSDAKKKAFVGRTPPVLYPKFPTTMSTTNNLYFDATGWPTKEECLKWNLPVDEKDELDLPVYLPPENKGFQVKKILSDYIGLVDNAQHELPWYPPVCDHPNASAVKYVPKNERQVLSNVLKANDILRNYLLHYVNDGKADEAEIGQRIITAMEKKSAPEWVLATLASLYWRVRGNGRKALDCLDLAFQIVPDDSTDVVLVSISSVVYQLGYLEQAINYASLAFKINYVEPSTNFLLAVLHYTNSNPLLGMYYMKNVLRVDSDYYERRAELLLKVWGCRIKLGGYNTPKQATERAAVDGGMCTKQESFKGEGVICSPNGDHCKTAAIQCYQTNAAEAEGTTVKWGSSNGCGPKHKLTLGHTLVSSLLAADGSGDSEPDQSRLETLSTDPSHPTIQMRLSLGEEHPTHEHLGDFYVSMALAENAEQEVLFYVYDKFGTYSLSPTLCKRLKITQKFTYASVWPSIVSRSLDLTSHLNDLPKSFNDYLQPYCLETSSLTASLDHLAVMVLRHRLPNSAEEDLLEMLQLMASDHKSTIEEFGAKLTLASRENSTSWILAAASAMYWRIVGNSEQAVTCTRLALANAPSNMIDIPLISLANLLTRIGFYNEALEVAHVALKINSKFVLNHFTIGNIFIAMGDHERAVSFYRACLALDSNFEPARHRLQVVLCTLLFDEAHARKHRHDLTIT